MFKNSSFLVPNFETLCLQKCPATIILEEWVIEVMEMSNPNRPLCSSLNSLKPSSHQGPPHCILTDLPFFEMAGNDFNPQNYSVYKQSIFFFKKTSHNTFYLVHWNPNDNRYVLDHILLLNLFLLFRYLISIDGFQIFKLSCTKCLYYF